MLFSALILIAFVLVLVVLAERSLNRQRGSMMKRTEEQKRALGHAETLRGRGGSGGGF